MSILARIGAVVLVVVALLPRGVARHDRILVVGLEGMREDYARLLAAAGQMPTFAALLERSLSGSLAGSSRGPSLQRWMQVLSTGSGDNARTIWEHAHEVGHRYVSVGVPGTDYLEGEQGSILAGADEARGFVGDNTGVVLNTANAGISVTDWPYVPAAGPIAEWAARLKPLERSEWLQIRQAEPDGREGAFRIYALDENTIYLSPLYARARDAEGWIGGGHEAGSGELYVPDEPTWTAPSSRIADYLYPHVRDLTAVRAEVAAALAESEWRLMIYVDTLLATVQRVTDPADEVDDLQSAGGIPSRLREAYATVDARLGRILARTGEDTVVVVVGLDPERRGVAPDAAAGAGGAPQGAGTYLIAGWRKAGTRDARTEQVAPTILYLAGISVGGADAAAPIEGVAAQYWQPRLARVNVGDHEQAQHIPLSADSLERLGALSTSAFVP